MSVQINPRLLSFLDKLVNPIQNLNFNIEIKGLFSFPHEWIVTEEQNPNTFEYVVQYQGHELGQGKIRQRIKTQREKYEEEQANLAKTKKKDKKGNIEISPEEEEQQKQLYEKWEQEEKRYQEFLSNLDFKQQFYNKQENININPQLRWTQQLDNDHSGNMNIQNSLIQFNKTGDQIMGFEDLINENKGDNIYFIRRCILSEEEIQKIKKAKSKTLQIQDLNPMIYKGFINLQTFLEPGVQVINVRVPLTQELQNDPNLDPPHFKPSQTYLYLNYHIDPPLTPQVNELTPSPAELIPKNQNLPKEPRTTDSINLFKAELVSIIDSFAQDYQNQFKGESQGINGQPSNNLKIAHTAITVQKKQEINNRKDKFLYEYVHSGKFKLLKDRLKKSILRLCKDKFQKEGFASALTQSDKNRLYSEMNIFLLEQMRVTLANVIANKKDDMHEDLSISHEIIEKDRHQIVHKINQESQNDRLIRSFQEFELLRKLDEANRCLLNLINLDPHNANSWYIYSKFLIRSKEYTRAEESLRIALQIQPNNNDFKLLMVALLVRRGRYNDGLDILKKNLLQIDKLNKLYNSFASFIYGQFLDNIKMSQKHFTVTQRKHQRNTGMLPSQGTKQEPNPFELQSYRVKIHQYEEKIARIPILDNHQKDELWMELIDYLGRFNLFDLVEKALNLLIDKTVLKAQFYRCQIEVFKDNYQSAINQLDKIIENHNQNINAYLYKANVCFLADKIYEFEETIYKASQIPGNKHLRASLRLGQVYLLRKDWKNAKERYEIIVQQLPTSSLAWLGLGISNFRFNLYREAEEALTQSNILDPYYSDTWGYLALLSLGENRLAQGQQSIEQMFKIGTNNFELLDEIGDKLVDILSKENNYKKSENYYRKVYELIMAYNDIHINISELMVKIGRVFQNVNKIEDANNAYLKAYTLAEGETDKQNIRLLIENLGVENNIFDNSLNEDHYDNE